MREAFSSPVPALRGLDNYRGITTRIFLRKDFLPILSYLKSL